MRSRSSSAFSLRSVATGVVIVLMAAGAGLIVAPAIFGDSSSVAPHLPKTSIVVPRSFDAKAVRTIQLSQYTTVIATSRKRTLRVYRNRKGHHRLDRVLRQRIFNRQRLPLVVDVTDHHVHGWLRVRLPQRPNGAKGWVRRRDVKVSATNWKVIVQLKRHRIIVRHGGLTIVREKIGVGRSLSPTPRGRYFITDLIKPPDPNGFYGPYAFGLSAYSTVYTSFEGGDGQVGIHGTNAPSGIGTNVSHGCIRVPNKVIRRLAKVLPLGTPVRIEY